MNSEEEYSEIFKKYRNILDKILTLHIELLAVSESLGYSALFSNEKNFNLAGIVRESDDDRGGSGTPFKNKTCMIEIYSDENNKLMKSLAEYHNLPRSFGVVSLSKNLESEYASVTRPLPCGYFSNNPSVDTDESEIETILDEIKLDPIYINIYLNENEYNDVASYIRPKISKDIKLSLDVGMFNSSFLRYQTKYIDIRKRYRCSVSDFSFKGSSDLAYGDIQVES